MSQHTIKQQRRFIRKMHRESYEATIRGMGDADARIKILRSFLRQKPRWMPQFVLNFLTRLVIQLPNEPK